MVFSPKLRGALKNFLEIKLGQSVCDNPFLKTLGVEIVLWKEGYVEMMLPFVAAHLNRHGGLHGGAIATLMDVSAGYAGIYSNEAPVHAVTLSLNVNYLDKGTGRNLIGKGFLERRGKSVYFARAEAWLGDQCMIATAHGVFKYIRK